MTIYIRLLNLPIASIGQESLSQDEVGYPQPYLPKIIFVAQGKGHLIDCER